MEVMDSIVATTSASLLSIGAASQKISEFQECLIDYEKIYAHFKELMEFLLNCEQVSNDLENERKSHAEELRIINQDINHLEDIMKGLKNLHEAKKNSITQKYLDFRRDLDQVNRCCRESGIPEENILTNENFHTNILKEMKGIDDTLNIHLPIPGGTLGQPQSSNSALLNLIASGKFPNSLLCNPFASFPFSNLPQIQPIRRQMSSNNHFQEDITKLKVCVL
uniref:Uncharacterized protein n=1 Tax=Acrobeloides nanus TaxID=290746 RepID=A0A914CF18_9BILA